RARLQLGSGPIVFAPQCTLSVEVGHGKGIELVNDLVLEDQCRVLLEPVFQRTNGAVRFTESMFMNGNLTVYNGGNFQSNPGMPWPFPDQFAGRLVLWQESSRPLLLNLNGSYGYRPFEISGQIVDGSGTASNRFEI